MNYRHIFYIFCLIVLLVQGCGTPKGLALENGLTISSSVVVSPQLYNLPSANGLDTSTIVIEGKNLIIDFNGATLNGQHDNALPDQFTGLAIRVKNSRSVTLKNLTITGFKVGIWAENVEDLTLENINLSNNYRERLGSSRLRENLADQLDFSDNTNDQWLEYGSAIYLKNCQSPTVTKVTVENGQNALLMHNTHNAAVFANNFSFNSGLGIGLHASTNNRLMHNRLNWNIRGHSFGIYEKGHGSAAVLLSAKSDSNTIAYNSATHSGTGLSLWAGSQSNHEKTASNRNLIYDNDFSYAVLQGVDASFGKNKIVNNVFKHCKIGVSGSYTKQTLVLGNQFESNQVAVSMELGQNNTLAHNTFYKDKTGIRLWKSLANPANIKKEAASKNIDLSHNAFRQVALPFEVYGSANVLIDSNMIYQSDKVIAVDYANSELFMVDNFYRDATPPDAQFVPNAKLINQLYVEDNVKVIDFSQIVEHAPDSLAKNLETRLDYDQIKGKRYIIITQWGPYNFKYPLLWPSETTDDNLMTFEILGPAGNWRIKKYKGVNQLDALKGEVPGKMQGKLQFTDLMDVFVEMEFTGRAGTTPFGKEIPKNQSTSFSFQDYDKPIFWSLSFFAFSNNTHPLTATAAFNQHLSESKPLKEIEVDKLDLTWWRKPLPGLPDDRFAIVALAKPTFEKGFYELSLTANDGARLYVDGELKIDNWSKPGIGRSQARMVLSGQHDFKVVYFDEAGQAVLQMDIQPVPVTYQ